MDDMFLLQAIQGFVAVRLRHGDSQLEMDKDEVHRVTTRTAEGEFMVSQRGGGQLTSLPRALLMPRFWQTWN